VEKLTTRLTTIAPFLRPDRATIEQAAELLTTTPTFERTFAAAVASLQGDLQRGGAPEVVLRLDGMLTALRDGLQRTDGQRFALPDTELTGVLLIDRGPVERYRSLDDASRTSGWPAIVLGVLVAVGAVLAAPRRRGALFGVGVAVFAAALVALASIALAKSAVVSQIDTSSGQDAVSAVWDVIALEVRRDLVWFMLAGLIVAVTGLSLQAFRPRRPPPPG
jgi:hypothetical protein